MQGHSGKSVDISEDNCISTVSFDPKHLNVHLHDYQRFIWAITAMIHVWPALRSPSIFFFHQPVDFLVVNSIALKFQLCAHSFVATSEVIIGLYILDFTYYFLIRPTAKVALCVEVVSMSRRLNARPRKAPLAIGFGAIIILVTGQAKSSQGFV